MLQLYMLMRVTVNWKAWAGLGRGSSEASGSSLSVLLPAHPVLYSSPEVLLAQGMGPDTLNPPGPKPGHVL